jgi:hypothetical protein
LKDFKITEDLAFINYLSEATFMKMVKMKTKQFSLGGLYETISNLKSSKDLVG